MTIWNSNVDLGEKDSRRVGPRELRGRLGEWEKVLDREERERERGKEKEKGGDKDYVVSFKEMSFYLSLSMSMRDGRGLLRKET